MVMATREVPNTTYRQTPKIGPTRIKIVHASLYDGLIRLFTSHSTITTATALSSIRLTWDMLFRNQNRDSHQTICRSSATLI